jgi:peptidoglycan LD-endopeptidase LytH
VVDPLPWPLAPLLGLVLAALPGQQPVDDGSTSRAFPVRGDVDYSRHHHDYPATDVFAGCGARVVAAVDGTVLEVGRSDEWDPSVDRGSRRGGKFVSVAGADRVRYYLSHLASVSPEIRAGAAVSAGQRLGRVGRTGSARGTPCHVHVGLSPVCGGSGEWRVRRGVVPPYRFLRSWQDGGSAAPGAAARSWRAEHGCP